MGTKDDASAVPPAFAGFPAHSRTLTRSPRQTLPGPESPVLSDLRLPAEGPCPAGSAHSNRTLSVPVDETRTNRSTPVSVQNADSIAYSAGICKFFSLEKALKNRCFSKSAGDPGKNRENLSGINDFALAKTTVLRYTTCNSNRTGKERSQ